jgi:hypothetical protein
MCDWQPEEVEQVGAGAAAQLSSLGDRVLPMIPMPIVDIKIFQRKILFYFYYIWLLFVIVIIVIIIFSYSFLLLVLVIF